MHAASVLDSAYSWKRLALTLLIATICNVGMWSIILIMPDVQSEFATDRAAASIPYTLTMAGFAIGNFAIGRAVDRFGITWALIGAAAALGVGYAGAAASSSIMMLSAFQALIGLGTAAGFAPLIADLSHWFLRRRGIAVAIVACGNYLAGVVWPTLLQGIQADSGWRGVYFALAAIIVVTVPPLSLTLRRRFVEQVSPAAPNGPAIETRAAAFSPRALQWLLGLAGVGCCVAMSMPQVHIVAYCGDLGYGVARGAEMLSIMLGLGVVSRITSGFIADKIGGLGTLLLGSTLQCAALLFYIPFDGLISLYVVSALFGLSQGGIVPSYAMIVRQYFPAREAGARVSLVLMTTVIGMDVGGWMSGEIYDMTGSYQAAFINGIAWNLLNMAIAFFLLMNQRQRRTA